MDASNIKREETAGSAYLPAPVERKDLLRNDSDSGAGCPGSHNRAATPEPAYHPLIENPTVASCGGPPPPPPPATSGTAGAAAATAAGETAESLFADAVILTPPNTPRRSVVEDKNAGRAARDGSDAASAATTASSPPPGDACKLAAAAAQDGGEGGVETIAVAGSLQSDKETATVNDAGAGGGETTVRPPVASPSAKEEAGVCERTPSSPPAVPSGMLSPPATPPRSKADRHPAIEESVESAPETASPRPDDETAGGRLDREDDRGPQLPVFNNGRPDRVITMREGEYDPSDPLVEALISWIGHPQALYKSKAHAFLVEPTGTHILAVGSNYRNNALEYQSGSTGRLYNIESDPAPYACELCRESHWNLKCPKMILRRLVVPGQQEASASPTPPPSPPQQPATVERDARNRVAGTPPPARRPVPVAPTSPPATPPPTPPRYSQGFGPQLAVFGHASADRVIFWSSRDPEDRVVEKVQAWINDDPRERGMYRATAHAFMVRSTSERVLVLGSSWRENGSHSLCYVGSSRVYDVDSLSPAPFNCNTCERRHWNIQCNHFRLVVL
ncbi:hypothetical protein DFJ73DRAFT_802953 [Zopfochytrium polystomum]|nr:hypothetical protein DFJ73DRAFT_802953 [Zopfochytrium polystomum]